uniref:Coiled-coil domain containing 187 n=1 Tax=Tetraodon nigroviridis TaxID=99883 RepID=H3D4S5_TETNG
MAELEVDHTNLPRVEEVCQCFAVLEDGALAHNLQEQEIEQYYSTNIQKNQLVQNDIRVAKRLQDEEEEQWAQESALQRQASKQLEEQDFEYARLVQEEILRCAEEAQRREQDDEEMAKRIHHEETQCLRRASRGQDAPSDGTVCSYVGEAGLDLGDLQQVLRDEELARKMQEDEEKCLRRNSQSSPPTCYPEGDFRAAQVAQDEEIAHFMQKQEMKSKRRSRELEGPSSWREHRAMISQHDRRAARDRQVQRERLDSEGLPSPTEDCSPENQQPSPTSTTLHSQYGIRNIAEELDPTFQARRQSTGRDQEGQTGMQQHEFSEEPTFIPPTKRQTDKSGRSKPKEKKETC